MKNIATSALAVAAALVVGGCSSLTPTEDPVYLRLTDLEARLLRLERVLQNESLITLSTQADQLRSDVASLRGQIEEVRFDVEGNAQRQRDLYLDLDTRLAALEQGQGQGQSPFGVPDAALNTPPAGNAQFPPAGAPSQAVGSPRFGASASQSQSPSPSPFGGNPPQLGANAAFGNAGSGVSSPPGSPGPSEFPADAGVAPPTTAGAPPPPVLTGSDRENYDRAYELLEPGRDYEGANRAFTEFLAAFPTSPLASNAQYWLAETYYVRNQFQEALPAFQRVVDEYPTSQKVPDALLKIGYTQDALGNTEAAGVTLRQVMAQFPNTTYARLASLRLSQPQFAQ